MVTLHAQRISLEKIVKYNRDNGYVSRVEPLWKIKEKEARAEEEEEARKAEGEDDRGYDDPSELFK
jgi:hypothetical protein